MGKNNGADLHRVADAINDGVLVDWDQELRANRSQVHHLNGLRIIESVIKAHREATGAGAPARVEDPETVEADETGAGAPTIAPRIGESGRRTTWGPLRLVERLGRGGFGEVYRAFDPTLKREVALKLRRARGDGDQRAEEQFITEARRLASVRHPNIVVVHGADRHDAQVGIWTDLVRGRTLEQVLSDQGPFGDHEAAAVGIALCGALAAVHGAGLVHRDVKTANIMREQGGRIVLMDFGSVIERASGDSHGSDGESVSGTPLYIAPEILLHGRSASPASDLYALGVVLFRLVTGRFPVEASSWQELIETHRGGRRLRLRDLRPELSPAFVQTVERALDPDPELRHETAGVMEQALAGSAGTTLTTSSVISARTGGRRAWAVAAGVAVVALAAALFLLSRATGGPLAVDAAIYRLGEGTEDRLLPGGRVRPGDRLFLEIEGQEPMYVYVLNEDEAGHEYVLFPAGLDLANPLTAGARHRLPGRVDGRQMTWVVTSAGQRENFLVIASRKPLDAIEKDLAAMPQAEQGRQVAYAQVSPEAMADLRGVGGMDFGDEGSEAEGAGTLEELSRRLSAGAARDQGLWTWHIQLENPE